jgi:hypothetical protein
MGAESKIQNLKPKIGTATDARGWIFGFRLPPSTFRLALRSEFEQPALRLVDGLIFTRKTAVV